MKTEHRLSVNGKTPRINELSGYTLTGQSYKMAEQEQGGPLFAQANAIFQGTQGLVPTPEYMTQKPKHCT